MFIETWAYDYGSLGIFGLMTTVIPPYFWAYDYGSLGKNWAYDYGSLRKTGPMTTVVASKVTVLERELFRKLPDFGYIPKILC